MFGLSRAPGEDLLILIFTPFSFPKLCCKITRLWLQKELLGGEKMQKKKDLWDVLPVKQKPNGLCSGGLLPPHNLATDFKPLAIGFILSASSEEGSRGHINAPRELRG